jgi:hypothetical protein
MSTRYTVKDVRTAYGALVEAATKAGLDTTLWKLHEGSSTGGRAYRIYDDGRSPLALSQGFIGLTARQAYDTIHAMLGVFWTLGDVHHKGVIDGWREAATAFIRTGHVDPQLPESLKTAS